jgi:branched-chain amino acid transport system substrate-binding protein
VKIKFEECETAYDTAKGVECYERLKNKDGGASGFDTQSTGITFAVTDKAPWRQGAGGHPGYGLSQSVDGKVFEWNFPLLGNYWTAADSIVQDILKKEKAASRARRSPWSITTRLMARNPFRCWKSAPPRKASS